jgi:PH (Pleckstrin Homology) domain-containing protein
VTEPTATIDTTAEEQTEAAAEAATDTTAAIEDPEAPKRTLPSWAPMAGAVVAGLAVAAPLLRTARQSHVHLRPDETVMMRIRPRRGVLRYIATLGFWELRRRASRVVVTDQRLLLEDGYLRRVVGSVPLSTVRGVVLRTSVWEAFVNVQTAGPRGGKTDIEIGPLSKGVAVELAAAVSPDGHVRALDD